MKRIEVEAGQRFGALVFVDRSGIVGLFRCDCGAEKRMHVRKVVGGQAKNCGCVRKAAVRAIGLANRTHGMVATPEYRAWHAMKNRCSNSRVKSYPDYGGRGITVCNRWLSFENFYADMGPKGEPSLSLDRIDNDKGYDPGNCRWATKGQQTANRRPLTSRVAAAKKAAASKKRMKAARGKTASN